MQKTAFARGCPLLHMTKSQLLSLMRISAVFLTVLFISYSVNASSQSVTLKASNLPLHEVFSTIKKQTGYVVFSNMDLLKNAKPVTVSVKEMPLKAFLDLILKDRNLQYFIVDKTISLSQRASTSFVQTNSYSSNGEKGHPDRSLATIVGKVVGSDSVALAGATVSIKGTAISTFTDDKGGFSIVADKGQVLVISFVGYQSTEINVGNATQLNIVLQKASSDLDGVVVVGYGVQRKATVTGSISSVKGDELSAAPIASTANTLAGRMPGLIAVQSSGVPGNDAASLSIRGFGGALIIVDGVESNFNNIDPNSIESISILKDGAAAIYGSRAGNGVILVTTKRGRNDKPAITLNGSYTSQSNTAFTKPVNSGQYAEMQSEEWLQAGKRPDQVPFTPEDIQKYYEATDPLYPNTNWYKEVIRDNAPQYNANLSVRGGNDRIRYYGFVGQMNQQTIFKKNGGEYNRFNFQSNIDAKITDNLSLRLDVSSIVENRQYSMRDYTNEIWGFFWNTLPIYPASFPDPTKISNADDKSGTGGFHVLTNREIMGSNDQRVQNLKGTAVLDYKISAVKGLSASAFVNYNQDYNSTKHFTKPVTFYRYDPLTEEYTVFGSLGTRAYMTQRQGQGRMLTSQFSVKYDRNFGGDHQLNVLALNEIIDYSNEWFSAFRDNFMSTSIQQLFAGGTTAMSNDGRASEMGRKGYIGRLNYAFRDKYIFESTLRADASAKFPKESRWGYFPGMSVAWRMTEERFLGRALKSFDDLKLRASYGSSGNDNVGNFQFLSGYSYGQTYLLGAGPIQGLASTGLANPGLTWEKIKIYNAGVDFSLWGRLLNGEVDVFYRERTGMPTPRVSTLPSTFGAALPPENLNSQSNRGIELRLGSQGRSGQLSWDVNGNISWSRARWIHFEESNFTDPDQIRVYKTSGRWTNVRFGFLSDGLFASQEEINTLGYNQDGQNNASLRPGDIKYKDYNSDGILDWRDNVVLGKGITPDWMFGMNGNLKYKNFDLSVLFQGAFGYYKDVYLVQTGLTSKVVYENRWIASKGNTDALIPRLGGSANNNSKPSDFYYKKEAYVRLKSMAIGYSIPQSLLQPLNIKQVRLYVAGTNLLTLSKLRKYGIDPEAPSGAIANFYPQQRTLTGGVVISL